MSRQKSIEPHPNLDTMCIEVRINSPYFRAGKHDYQKFQNMLETLEQRIADHNRDLKYILDDCECEEDLEFDADLYDFTTDLMYDVEYIVDDIPYPSVAEALMDKLDFYINERTTYQYSNKSDSGGYNTWHDTNNFSEVIEHAYHNPNNFVCNGMNEEESKFITAVLALAIEEKLIM